MPPKTKPRDLIVPAVKTKSSQNKIRNRKRKAAANASEPVKATTVKKRKTVPSAEIVKEGVDKTPIFQGSMSLQGPKPKTVPTAAGVSQLVNATQDNELRAAVAAPQSKSRVLHITYEDASNPHPILLLFFES
ncbi:hypothetical protein Q9L58_001528 [Maublancomyces gigas]|uniref:Uncharacterized protein n=1 Tax=Discina gigas TaxID=1032678 RepID=A0ABR3GU89_9PEZI